MAANYWIKLYHEILDDPKMGRLPDSTWRMAIECFLLAGERGDGGQLPGDDDIAWRLRKTNNITPDLERLQDVGILHRADAGDLVVTHFAERQAPVPPTERKQRQRERDQRHNYYDTTMSRNVTEPVTNCETDKIRIDTDKNRVETESGADAPREAAPAPVPVPVLAPLPVQENYENQEPPSGISCEYEDNPSTFQGWYTALQETKNRSAVLRRMFVALYPAHDAPEFGYLGKVARQVGGVGRLAELLWQHSARPPTGDVLAYCAAAAKSGGNGKTPPRDVNDDVEAVYAAYAATSWGRNGPTRLPDPWLQAVADSLAPSALGSLSETTVRSRIRDAWFKQKGQPAT